MTNRPIYLDYMATTPIDPHVIKQMLNYMGPNSNFGNPASHQHGYGQTAALAVDRAREQIAHCVGTSPEAIIFTSGATEANNLAILGTARFYQRKGRHVITMTTEHKAVLDSFQQLEREGFTVTYLPPQSHGLLDLNLLANALQDDTILVSIMHVNNEIGVIQNIREIGELLRGKGIIFHVDAAQSAGKLPINLNQLNVDLMSFSAHKIYGPKGVGALYMRQKPRIRLQALTFGGGHEHGLRAGTLATHQIVGMGEAFALAETLREKEQAHILTLRQQLWDNIKHLPYIQLNGHATERVAGNLNISVDGIESTDLLSALHGIAVSTTSACLSASFQPSYVLKAIGVPPDLALSSIRISIGRYTTADDIQKTSAILQRLKPVF